MHVTYFYCFIVIIIKKLAQFENQLQEGIKIQPPQENQRNTNQVIIPICSLTFQVTTNLLWVTRRSLTSQMEPNWTSW